MGGGRGRRREGGKGERDGREEGGRGGTSVVMCNKERQSSQ
jgi:hypothetical protein